MPCPVQPIRASFSVKTVLLVGFLALFVTAPLFAANGHPPKKKDTKRQVELIEESWRAAQLAGDATTMDKMLSDDYIGISMSGQVSTKAQQLDRVRARKVTLSKVELSDVKVKLLGGIAIVTAQADIEGTNENGSVKGTYRYTRVYKRLSTGEWKITSFEATRIPGTRVTGQQRDQVQTETKTPPVN